jgi:beta-lactamase regulating signal transducer with metallopeptidase domain
MIDVFIEAANEMSRPWMVWILSSLLDSSLLLVGMTLLWWAIRRHAAPQVGYILFLLIPLKLILPLNVAAPSVIARMAPSVIIGHWMASFDNHSVASIDEVPQAPVQATSPLQRDSTLPVIPQASAIPITTALPETASMAAPQTAVEHSLQRVAETKVLSPLRYEAWLMLGWTGIVILLLGRLVFFQIRFRTRIQPLQNSECLPSDIDLHSLCQRAGIHQNIQLVVSDQVTVPAVFGITRPVILLPHTIAATLSTQQLQWVLLHELAHIRRRDLLVVGFQNLVTALQFFNPAIWIANRIIHQLREYACDDLAVALNNGSAVDPGEAFLAILRQANRPPRNHFGALGIFGLDPRSACFDRVRRLIDTERPLRTKLGGLSTCALLLIAFIVLPRIHAANAPAESQTTKNSATPKQPAAEAVEPLARDVGQFELQVVDPDGKPVTQSNIEFRGTTIPTSAQILQGKFTKAGRYGAFVDTDADGRVVISFPREPDSFSVNIEIPGFAPYSAEWSSQSHPEPIPARFTVKLSPAWSVGSIVVDGQGKPVAGVEVRPSIKFLRRPGDTSELGIGARRKTDEAGRWRFDSTPSSKDEVWVEISHPDFKPLRRALSRSEFGIGQGQEPLGKIVLDPGLTVRGTVTDEDGNPIADALVRSKFMNDIRQTTTKLDGSYELLGCESRMAKIVVSAKGRAIDKKELRIVPEMDPVNFELTQGRTIRIRVLDKNEKPLPKARIFFQKWRGDFYDYFEFGNVNQYTNEQGAWEWNEAPVDGFQADICHPNGMYLSHQPLIARDEEYVFHPPGPLVITGNVIDATTKMPLKKFDVVPGFRFDNGELYWEQKGRFTASDGKYRLQQRDGRMAYLVRIEASGYRTEVSRDIKPDEENTTVEFELKPARDITGVVVAPDGTLAVGARIAVAIAGTQLSIR